MRDYAYDPSGVCVGEVTHVVAGWLALPPDRNETAELGFNGRAYPTRQDAVDALVRYDVAKQERFGRRER
jgi:hypothetical protein